MRITKTHRFLLAVYMLGFLALFALPFDEPEFYLLGIRSDKWIHAAFFAGLVMLIWWNMLTSDRGGILAVLSATAIALAGEIIQVFLVYRSADFLDLLAGLVGVFVGGVVMYRIVKLPAPEKVLGVLAGSAGILLIVVSTMADHLGLGDTAEFGVQQIGGTVLGIILVILGGCAQRNSGDAVGGH